MTIRGRHHAVPVIFLLISISFGAGTLAAAPAQAATTPVAHGTVTAADGSGPIAGITVCATHRNTKGGYGAQRCTETTADGRYSIAVASSLYSISAEQRDLYGSWLPQDYNHRKAYSFVTTPSRTFNFALVRGAKISGVLHAPDGGDQGQDAVEVEAYRVDSHGHAAKDSSAFSNVTHAGYFEVSKLPAGTYKLLVKDNDGPVVYAQQWYPNAAAASGGTGVAVTAGQHVTGRDMTLTVPGSITLTLRKPSGSLARGQVQIYDLDGREIWQYADGDPSTRTITGLHPGAYKVRAMPSNVAGYREWYTYKRTFATANPIAVTSGATTTRTLKFHY